MDKALMQLIETTADELTRAEQALWPEGEDYSSFCRHAEALTDLLIRALFPRHAPDSVSRQGTLREAVLHLEACLSPLFPDSPQADEVISALLLGLPEVRRRQPMPATPPRRVWMRSFSAIRPLLPSAHIGWHTSSMERTSRFCRGS